jgi:hypothetical protein
MTGPLINVNVNACVVVAPRASVTRTVKLNAPDTDGLPDTTPVVSFNVNPAGNAPDEIDHTYGEVPPVTVNVCEYETSI